MMKDAPIKRQLAQTSQDINTPKNIIIWRNRVFVPTEKRHKEHYHHENRELDKCGRLKSKMLLVRFLMC
ncbi:hypothetical protein JF634_10450 [Simonsiella muelleri]|uniref:hypothetical protein n=1 Tax=Simonsiella muelleri TaxID=72 RepID=UPI00131A3487|nr:hypothetical protein [Simonsiella muelleri]UBQ53572.1 hypothetical protein JF634_10450 [Simonsiella muelleri]